MNGVSIPPLEPGSAEWLRVMSASRVATLFGLNDKYDSPFHLWSVMAGKIDAPAQTKEQARGHYLEAGVAAWFRDQHPEWGVMAGECWAHKDRPWQTCSPDRLLSDGAHLSLLEVKTDGSWSAFDEWGTPGTDEVPARYRVQVMWQLDTLGLDHGYIAVLLPGLNFAEYRIDYDADEAALYRKAAREFLDSIAADTPPPIDASPWTYRALRRLPVGVEDRSVEVGRDVADLLKAGAELTREAARIKQEAVNHVLAAIGSGRKAYYVDDDGARVPVATRTVNRSDGSTRSLRIAPSLNAEEEAA